MSAETAQIPIDSNAETIAPLQKVDSAIDGLSSSPTHHKTHRRTSSSFPGVTTMEELQDEGKEIEVDPETQKTAWKINTPPKRHEDFKVYDERPLITPLVKKITLHFPLGLEVVARNPRGVKISDAMEAIHKQFKKKADDELEAAYLRGFEWDKEECFTRLIVHLSKIPVMTATQGSGGSKKKKKQQQPVEDDLLV